MIFMGKFLDAIRKYIQIERSDKFLDFSIMPQPEYTDHSSYGSPSTDKHFKA